MPAAKKKSSAKSKRAAPKQAVRAAVAEGLAQAAWAEADRALARALIDADLLAAALVKPSRRAADALDLLQQSLSQAARKRGLSRLGEIGAKAQFDAERHVLGGAPRRTPKQVRIVTPGVARGQEVLVKAEVDRIRRTQ